MTKRLDLSVIVPVHGTPFERPLEVAAAAEAAGLDGVWVPDHLINKTRPEAGVHECLTTLAVVAAQTPRIRLGTLVVTTPFRHPAILAKSAAAIDAVAPGRLTLGLGAGGFWYEETCRRLGFPLLSPGERLRNCEETVLALRSLWQGEPTTFRGEFAALDGARVHPKPARPVPIAIAARKPRMLELVARSADIWSCPLPHELGAGLKAIAEAGRAASSIRTAVFAIMVAGATEAEAKRNLDTAGPAAQMFGDVETHHLFGTAERIADRMLALARQGADEITLDLRGMAAIESIEMLRTEILPRLGRSR